MQKKEKDESTEKPALQKDDEDKIYLPGRKP